MRNRNCWWRGYDDESEKGQRAGGRPPSGVVRADGRPIKKARSHYLRRKIRPRPDTKCRKQRPDVPGRPSNLSEFYFNVLNFITKFYNHRRLISHLGASELDTNYRTGVRGGRNFYDPAPVGVLTYGREEEEEVEVVVQAALIVVRNTRFLTFPARLCSRRLVLSVKRI
ncbi:hypothetical protein GWI33_013928 [Rhynchophorus ferrugineus]|uniref:Uncharacterized protein n=1 Tax=Rhynchophorus ferrugineus TaxID=354439 RepID=A0A834M7C7_RHYFE|nr:hypothetical protein GWI33_013928 [Rhynchophorus ferrugineus]